MLVRVALVLASLALIAFVFTQTVGDPSRGERVAAAVLADRAARAEVTAPVTGAVMSTTGLPPEQRPVVEAQVDRLLASPNGARAFIDPFAGAWARLLGQDDPRPAEFDLAPLLSQLVAETGGVPEGVVIPDRLPVSGVPLPRVELGWMSGVRSAVSAAALPLALAATVLFAIGFALGDRAWALRRLGIWAILAGAFWLVIPPLFVWMARRWAPGADAVVAVALDESTSGLLPVAVALVAGGAGALAASFAVAPAREQAPSRPLRQRVPATATAPASARAASTPTVNRPTRTTAEMPTVPTTAPPPTTTAELPAQRSPEPPRAQRPPDDDDDDPLWEFYS